jgi:hypothetical protein
VRTNLVRVTVASVLLFGAAARAQWSTSTGFRANQTIWALNWEIAGPIGDFSNYISNWSLRGFSLEGRYLLQKNLSVGASFSFNRWEQTYINATVPFQFGSIQNGAVNGTLYRYADMFGLRAVAHYYFGDGPIQPYAGFGIGGVWSYSYQQIVDLSLSQNGFHFIISPEVGALATLSSGSTSVALNVAFRYTFTTASPGRTKDAQFISPIIGLAWYY